MKLKLKVKVKVKVWLFIAHQKLNYTMHIYLFMIFSNFVDLIIMKFKLSKVILLLFSCYSIVILFHYNFDWKFENITIYRKQQIIIKKIFDQRKYV